MKTRARGKLAPKAAAAVPGDRLLSVGEACDLFGTVTGRRPSPSSISRWISRGIRGKRLDCVRVGGRFFISRAAVASFVQATEIPLDIDAGIHAATVERVLGRKWGGGGK